MLSHGADQTLKTRMSCDFCSRSKLKCSQERPACRRCVRGGRKDDCSYSTARRPGRRRRPYGENAGTFTVHQHDEPSDQQASRDVATSSQIGSEFVLSDDWQCMLDREQWDWGEYPVETEQSDGFEYYERTWKTYLDISMDMCTETLENHPPHVMTFDGSTNSTSTLSSCLDQHQADPSLMESLASPSTVGNGLELNGSLANPSQDRQVTQSESLETSQEETILPLPHSDRPIGLHDDEQRITTDHRESCCNCVKALQDVTWILGPSSTSHDPHLLVPIDCSLSAQRVLSSLMNCTQLHSHSKNTELVTFSIMGRLLEVLKTHFGAVSDQCSIGHRDDPERGAPSGRTSLSTPGTPASAHQDTLKTATTAIYIGHHRLSDDVNKQCIQELIKLRLKRDLKAVNRNLVIRSDSNEPLDRAISMTSEYVIREMEVLLGMMNV